MTLVRIDGSFSWTQIKTSLLGPELQSIQTFCSVVFLVDDHTADKTLRTLKNMVYEKYRWPTKKRHPKLPAFSTTIFMFASN